MKPILTNRTNKAGQPLYFIGYSKMKYNGKPLLILATDPENKNTYGHYTKEANNETISNS